MARPDYPEEGLHPQVRFHLRRLRLPVRAIRFHIPLVLGLLQPQSQIINRGYRIVEEGMPLRPYLLNQKQKHDMGKRISPFLAAMLALSVLCPAVSVQAEDAPYVNAAVADTEFSNITVQCMDIIRSKKILLASYSWGLGMRSGLYSVPDDYGYIYNTVGIHYSADYDVRAAGSYNVIPSNAFEVAVVPMLVHYIGLGDGHTVPEFGNLIRNGPWYFKNVIDVAMVFGDDPYDNYPATFDALRSDFPNIKFIYTTSGLAAITDSRGPWMRSWSANIRALYKNVAPLYDYEYIVNDDGRCGDGYCPEYSTDPAGIHPNTRFINNRAAKGFLLMLSN